MKNDLASLIRSFFQERLVEQKRLSPHTIASYRDSLRLLLGYVSVQTMQSPAKLTLDTLNVERILEFLNDLEQNRGCCVRSRNQRLASIKALCHHIAFKEPEALELVQQVLEIPYKRYTRPMFGFLVQEEVNAILEAPDRTSKTGMRDYALLLFLYNTGARISEATQLQISQLHLSAPYQVLILGKGDKERVVPLWKNTAAVIAKWLTIRMSFAPGTNHVFINSRGELLSRGGGRYILNQAVAIASITCPALGKKKISPHTLRHTTAMHLLQSGVDVNVIRMWLGHVSLDTTHHYIEADLDMKRRALEKGGILSATPINEQQPSEDEILAFLSSL